MRFHLFLLPTVGRRPELERGMAGQDDALYRRTLREIAEQARWAEELGYWGIGFTEHHFHIEGFEISNNPVLLDLFVGLQTRRLRVGQLAIVLPAHHPLRVAEDIAMLDQMTGGRAYAGFARGYQARWVDTLAQGLGLGATPSDRSERDLRNRRAFEEAWRIIRLAWTRETFSYDGEFWKVPPPGISWPNPATRRWGRGVAEDGTLKEVGIAPRPLQKPHPPVYAPFAFSFSTVRFWAREGGTPVVLSGDLDFCRKLFTAYQESAREAGRDLAFGEGIALGGTLCIAETEEEAEGLRRTFDWLFQEWFAPFGFPPGLVLAGTPRQVARQVEGLYRALGFRELFLWVCTGLYPHETVMRQLELFARKVMPALDPEAPPPPA